ncbi:PAS domain-containing protein [Flavobacterium sp. TSSA_36]|jgi:PAS domain S-box-containing protein|uniref:PAS domain-containing protein n=1 Tax=Flavobacterium sp. TSSA_36 TaxID=3447669 RepID=UPI003F35DFF7
MKHITDYENAKAKYFETLDLKATSMISLSFHGEFFGNIRHSFADYKRLNKMLPKNTTVVSDEVLRCSLLNEVIIVTNDKLEIVFASNNLAKMNGYTEKEVLGNSPKMFHGEKTNPETSKNIREKILSKLPFESKVINYKKNGKIYDCLIRSLPIFDAKGKLTHFIAFEKAF